MSPRVVVPHAPVVSTTAMREGPIERAGASRRTSLPASRRSPRPSRAALSRTSPAAGGSSASPTRGGSPRRTTRRSGSLQGMSLTSPLAPSSSRRPIRRMVRTSTSESSDRPLPADGPSTTGLATTRSAGPARRPDSRLRPPRSSVRAGACARRGERAGRALHPRGARAPSTSLPAPGSGAGCGNDREPDEESALRHLTPRTLPARLGFRPSRRASRLGCDSVRDEEGNDLDARARPVWRPIRLRDLLALAMRASSCSSPAPPRSRPPSRAALRITDCHLLDRSDIRPAADRYFFSRGMGGRVLRTGEIRTGFAYEEAEALMEDFRRSGPLAREPSE